MINYPRTTSPTEKEKFWEWDVQPSFLLWQCTWYVNGRSAEICGQQGMLPWYAPNGDRSYSNAENWKVNSDVPHVGDIVVWSGNKGHVAVVEHINPDGTLIISHSGATKHFNYGEWTPVPKGTLDTHIPNNFPDHVFKGYYHWLDLSQEMPVARDENKNQINIKTDNLRLRTQPKIATDNEVALAIRGVYDSLEQVNADGYVWHRIGSLWVAQTSNVEYLPKSDNNEIQRLKERINELEGKLEKIEGIING